MILGAALACGAAPAVLLALSNVDPALLVTLRTATENGNTIAETRYNPFGVVVFGALAIAVCGGAVLLFRLVISVFYRERHLGADRVASVSETFGRELGNALTVIRHGLTNNTTFARSLVNAQARLSGPAEVEQVRIIVGLLVAENERARLAIADDKNKLEACARKIESLKVSLRGVEEATLRDPLTGIGNRRLFDEAMQEAVKHSNARKAPLSLIICDIDHFKRVNDTFGHPVGDEIIKAFVGIIASSVRETDSVARYGGEEFAIILPGTKQRAAKETAERIRRQFGSRQFSIRKTNQRVGQITASFGVAEHRPGDDVETLIQRADAKLYEAKARGRDRVEIFTNTREG